MTAILIGLLAWLVTSLALGVSLGRMIHAVNPIDEG